MPSKFRSIIKSGVNKDILIPRIRSSLYRPDFSEFSVKVSGFEHRKPDGRFHPSEHPLWSEDKLVAYLKGKLDREPMDISGVFAVTQGSFWHSFLQTIGIQDGWLKVSTPNVDNLPDQAEFAVNDEELGTGGHMDGILNSELLGLTTLSGLEIKSMNGFKASKCPNGSPDDPAKINWLKVEHPTYDAQAQEYMRMSGIYEQRFLFLTLEYPYPMREVVLPFDPILSKQITDKYRRVRERVANES